MQWDTNDKYEIHVADVADHIKVTVTHVPSSTIRGGKGVRYKDMGKRIAEEQKIARTIIKAMGY